MNGIKGYRTKLLGWISAFGPILALFGYEINPELLLEFLDKFDVLLASGYTLLGSGIHHYRDQAGK